MRLLLIVDSYPPDTLNAAGRMMRELADCLIEQGHEILLVAPSPSIAAKFELVREGELSVLRARSRPAKGQSHLARGLAEIGFPVKLWSALSQTDWMRNSVDGVVWYSPSIFFGPLVAWIKWRYRAHAYLILRDIFPNWALETGTIKRGVVALALRAIAELQYLVADTIGIQAEKDGDYLSHLPPEKIQVLPNWVSKSREAISPPDWMQERWFTDNEIIVMGGALGPAQDPDVILRLASRLKARPTAIILIVGDGDRSAFFEESRRLGLENIVIKPGLDGPDFDLLLAKAKLGLISLHPDLRTQNVPGRFLSHLNAGLPTVASLNKNSQLFELFQQSQCGIAIASGDDDGFYEAAIRVLDHPKEREFLAANAKLLAKRFQPAEAARSILNRLGP
ncbi:MAG: hypothetical protein CFE32_05120 [Alphaproteobacteria bacterium PA3]|nr:MAG: hypothetical protein CFE32_05120 [Alphaproteobacteria bacterium PA3]